MSIKSENFKAWLLAPPSVSLPPDVHRAVVGRRHDVAAFVLDRMRQRLRNGGIQVNRQAQAQVGSIEFAALSMTDSSV